MITGLKKIKIYQTKYFYAMLILLLVWIMVLVVMLILYHYSILEAAIEVEPLIGAVLIGLIGFIGFLLALILAIREKNNYNALIEKGIVLSGKIENMSESPLGIITFVVSVIDEKTGRKHRYEQQSYENRGTKKLMCFINEDNRINVLVDPNNYVNGYILFEEYYNKQDWKIIDKTHERRKDGSYKPISNTIKQQVETEEYKIVTGKLLKKSIKKTIYNSFSGIIRIDATVTYFENESGKLMVFKGTADILPEVQWKLEKQKEPISVQVQYDIRNENNYTVYLREALESLE